MFKFSVLISALLILAMIFGCDDDPVKSAPFDYFPNKVGSVWVYDVYDSTVKISSELTITITGYVELENGQQASVWVQTINPETDPIISYVVETGDSVNAYTNLAGTDLSWSYWVPLTVDRGWMVHHEGAGGGGIADTSTVLRVESVSVPHDDFANVPLVETTPNAQIINYFYVRKDWFVPGVGLVQKNIEQGSNLQHSDETWLLNYYELPKSLPD